MWNVPAERKVSLIEIGVRFYFKINCEENSLIIDKIDYFHHKRFAIKAHQCTRYISHYSSNELFTFEVSWFVVMQIRDDK